MHIRALSISNFRGIQQVELDNLGVMVVIAGQNGSGKSCVFDAIRLLKSVYGGYQQNEIHQWMGEFQVDLFRNNFSSMLNDPSGQLRITCDFQLSEEERAYLTENAEELLRESLWRALVPEAYQWSSAYGSTLMPQYREKEAEVRSRVSSQLSTFRRELDQPLIKGAFYASGGASPQASYEPSLVLSVVFSLFRPEQLGVIDYHGAQRHYGREAVQGVNLNLDANAQQRSQTALYNYGAKYTNVKGEMAASYVKEILAGRALGSDAAEMPSLTNTLKELFSTFFPEKEFLGPQPTPQGALAFPVRTANGSTHDLDELSAGEKEILYGYLRIRNSAPKNSIILLDEPELHLNPRLIRSLPAFYRKHLGEALGNQIWLVTHSDALMREVVGSSGYDVFHMLPCGSNGGHGQLKRLSASGELEALVIDLVGDLASYHPGGKVVILEGGGDSDFDQRVIAALFPELQQRVNLVSGSNKVRVKALHETLRSLSQQRALPLKFYAITDRDSDSGSPVEGVGQYQWDVYHIENYFLSAAHVRTVTESLGVTTYGSDEQLLEELKACAETHVTKLVRKELAAYANELLVGAIDTRSDPQSANVVNPLIDSIDRSRRRINNVVESELGGDKLRQRARQIEARFRASLEDGSWIEVFPGRNILKAFVDRNMSGVSYERFRNLILSKMRDSGHQPSGMKAIVEGILAS